MHDISVAPMANFLYLYITYTLCLLSLRVLLPSKLSTVADTTHAHILNLRFLLKCYQMSWDENSNGMERLTITVLNTTRKVLRTLRNVMVHHGWNVKSFKSYEMSWNEKSYGTKYLTNMGRKVLKMIRYDMGRKVLHPFS